MIPEASTAQDCYCCGSPVKPETGVFFTIDEAMVPMHVDCMREYMEAREVGDSPSAPPPLH